MSNTHVMLDLETLSTSPNAAILQIGMCRFDADNVWDQERICVDLQSLLSRNFTVDGATVCWWMGQSDAARSSVFSGGMPIESALGKFRAWWNAAGVAGQKVWSHGASFDVPIMDSAHRRLGTKVPWDYRDVRDTRTLFELAGGVVGPKPEVPHDAMHDAVAQAVRVQMAWRVIKERTEMKTTLMERITEGARHDAVVLEGVYAAGTTGD